MIQSNQPHVREFQKSTTIELHGVQMLRGVAALAVVVHHALEQSNAARTPFSPDWLTTSGASGVDIFFVISGFIMLYVTFQAGKTLASPSQFLFRRITRIYPLYWLCCFAVLLLAGVGFYRSHSWSTYEIFASFLLLPSGGKLIGVSWTLVYEMYFYLVFAAMLYGRSLIVAVAGTTSLIIAILFAAVAAPVSMLSQFLADPIVLEFCLGLAIAALFLARVRAGRDWPLKAWMAIPAFGLLFAAPVIVEHDDTAGLPGLARVIAWGLPSAWIVACFLSVGRVETRIGRSIVALGDASYAIYLTHAFVMIGYGRAMKSGIAGFDQRPVVVAVVLASLAIGVATHLVVETRLLALVRRGIVAGRVQRAASER